MWLEREKDKMSMKQTEAKYLTSVASNDAKSKIHTQEIEKKADAVANR